MSLSSSFSDHARDLFHSFGEIRIRKMFGGAGVYCDDLFFALLDDDTIWLKADDATRKEFESRGLSPFTYETKDGVISGMSYYSAPEEIFDDEDELKRWTTLALDAAKRAAKFKKKKKSSDLE